LWDDLTREQHEEHDRFCAELRKVNRALTGCDE